eukprot:TRINITY_DN783_c3_g1_i1.p1 TRINITY_DN783_c3_g1~~TRINITY_DN783_c3_g1_i1.p1  ORF type:complete len:606 (+),score=117.50 TRINITY_DN783_c3_g1_i1:43-1818(+)
MIGKIRSRGGSGKKNRDEVSPFPGIKLRTSDDGPPANSAPFPGIRLHTEGSPLPKAAEPTSQMDSTGQFTSPNHSNSSISSPSSPVTSSTGLSSTSPRSNSTLTRRSLISYDELIEEAHSPKHGSDTDVSPRSQIIGARPRVSPVVPSRDGSKSTNFLSFSGKSSRSTQLFGVPLEVAARRSDPLGLVPAPVRKCVEYLNLRALNAEGIYRVPGSQAKVKQYISQFNEGVQLDFCELNECVPATVAMTLIKFFNELPESLLTRALEPKFAELINSLQDAGKNGMFQVLPQILGLLLSLPLTNRETIRCFAEHLRLIAEHSDVNKMTLTNIGITLGISLSPTISNLLRLLIENPDLCPQTVVYGVPLEQAITNSDLSGLLPAPLVAAIDYISQEGYYKSELLYNPKDRNDPAWIDTVRNARMGFDQGRTNVEDELSPDVVSELIVLYIRFLPEHLCGDVSDQLKQLGEYHQPDKIQKVKNLLAQLPDANSSTLKLLVVHLFTVLQYSTVLEKEEPSSEESGEEYPRMVLDNNNNNNGNNSNHNNSNNNTNGVLQEGGNLCTKRSLTSQFGPDYEGILELLLDCCKDLYEISS